MNNADSLRRDNKSNNPLHFDALSTETRKALTRAAARGAANLTPDQVIEIGTLVNVPGWLMVPTKNNGLRQVSVDVERAWRF